MIKRNGLDPDRPVESRDPAIVAVAEAGFDIAGAVKKAMEMAGGLESEVHPGDKIYLKPNFVAPRDSETGATTDFRVIRAVAEEVRRCGGEPLLYETPALDFEREVVFKVLGVREFARANGIGLVEDGGGVVVRSIPGGRAFSSIAIPRVLDGAKIINLPKLKTHVTATMTCGLKNLIGALPPKEKRRVHIRGVHRAIADLSLVFRPVLTVVDAVTAMEGDGPTYGTPVRLGLVVAGRDMAAVDMACCGIMGLSWESVPYLRLINRPRDGGAIRIVGDSPGRAPRIFKTPPPRALYDWGGRLMYSLDGPFSTIFSRSLLQWLYGTGYIGTNPKIIGARCDRCGDCRTACPVPEALDLDRSRVAYRLCVRCLKCFEACSREAIAVKGLSRPEGR